MDLTLVVLAAGMSTRYGRLKQLEPIGPRGEALMDYAVFDAVRAGCSSVVFVVRPEIEAPIRAHVAKLLQNAVHTAFVHQTPDAVPTGRPAPAERVKPWGTAHALLCAEEATSNRFIAVNADDLYGRDAYRSAATHLRLRQQDANHPFALVGYRLDQTLSQSGGVSRAVCEVDEKGLLTSIAEFHSIARSGSRIRGHTITNETRWFDGSETVSMNMWGFDTSVFPILRQQFDDFLSTHENDPNAEFLIPTAIAEQLARETATVQVLRTDAEWMGVTFPQDREAVVRKTGKMVADGIYPSDLEAWFRRHGTAKRGG